MKKGVAFFDRGSEGSGEFSPAGRAGEYQRRQSEEIEKPVVSISSRKENQFAREQCEKLTVKTSSIHKKIAELSGGNQQKALLARWLAMDPGS